MLRSGSSARSRTVEWMRPTQPMAHQTHQCSKSTEKTTQRMHPSSPSIMRIKTFSLAAARHKNVRHSDGYVEYLEHQKYIHVQAIQHDWDFPSEKETTGSTAREQADFHLAPLHHVRRTYLEIFLGFHSIVSPRYVG